jgi:transcriptional regulator with XRE-family HTH domain
MGTRKGETAGDYARMVSAEVRRVLGDKRVSGNYLARELNVSQNYLSKRLRDQLPFTLNDVERIAGVLGMEFEELVLPAATAYDRKKSPREGK